MDKINTSRSGSGEREKPIPLVRARQIGKIYQRGRQSVEALRGVSLDITGGSLVAILGPSGGGKSTLLHILGGVDRPTCGTVQVGGFSLEGADEPALDRFRREFVGFVFQFDNLLPSLSALDNVALPLAARGWKRQAAYHKARKTLEIVGLHGRLEHKPGELSGGQQQRVAIARAVVGEPRLVLADEPTGDLDSDTARGVLDLIQDLNRRLGITFIIATHNETLARAATEVYNLHDGQLSARRGRDKNGAG